MHATHTQLASSLAPDVLQWIVLGIGVQVVIAKTQQITLRHWLPLVGISEESVRNYSPEVSGADISLEFFITYRFGHDLIGERIGSFKVKDIFNGEEFFGITSADGSKDPAKANHQFETLLFFARGSLSANLDGKFSDALRNTLFGPFGEDLATRNMWRSMEVGMQPYDQLAACYGVTASPKVRLMHLCWASRAPCSSG